jgi:hypothetical protein
MEETIKNKGYTGTSLRRHPARQSRSYLQCKIQSLQCVPGRLLVLDVSEPTPLVFTNRDALCNPEPPRAVSVQQQQNCCKLNTSRMTKAIELLSRQAFTVRKHATDAPCFAKSPCHEMVAHRENAGRTNIECQTPAMVCPIS